MTSSEVEALRSAQRLKVFQPAELIEGARHVRAHVLDVSRTGALVHSDGAPSEGSTLTLRIADRDHRARVVWRHAKQFGLTFLLPLSAIEIEAIITGHREMIESGRRRFNTPEPSVSGVQLR